MFQSVRDKASLAELAVVGSQPARVALKLDTKETKRGEKGVRGAIFEQVKGGGLSCVANGPEIQRKSRCFRSVGAPCGPPSLPASGTRRFNSWAHRSNLGP